MLPRLVQKDKLRCVRFGKRLVYTVPRRTKGKKPTLAKEKIVYQAGATEKAVLGRNKIIHGLACTEGLVRFWRSDMDGEIIAERYFYGCGAVPEWGLRYPNGKLLLYEFCTESNYLFSNNMKGKLNAYRNHLKDIEKKFESEAIVLFVLDISRDRVERFVGSLKRDAGSVADGEASAPYDGGSSPDTPLFFTDYETFLKVPIGYQMTAPIYLWSYDGKAYPLRRKGK
jgi:hypothetical protein